MKQISESECGHGVFIVSGKEVFVGEAQATFFNNKPWSLLRKQSILVPAEESYSPISAYMINSCEKSKCDPNLMKFKIKIDSVTPK
ncbi:MAG: hypothetical protein ACHQUC_01425 [Chlamydiales bacterium]